MDIRAEVDGGVDWAEAGPASQTIVEMTPSVAAGLIRVAPLPSPLLLGQLAARHTPRSPRSRALPVGRAPPTSASPLRAASGAGSLLEAAVWLRDAASLAMPRRCSSVVPRVRAPGGPWRTCTARSAYRKRAGRRRLAPRRCRRSLLACTRGRPRGIRRMSCPFLEVRGRPDQSVVQHTRPRARMPGAQGPAGLTSCC
jgi:hypothetical protein